MKCGHRLSSQYTTCAECEASLHATASAHIVKVETENADLKARIAELEGIVRTKAPKQECEDCRELMKYIDEAKLEAQKRGRVMGQPLAHWIASLPLDPWGGPPASVSEARKDEPRPGGGSRYTHDHIELPDPVLGDAPLASPRPSEAWARVPEKLLCSECMSVIRALRPDSRMPCPNEARPPKHGGLCPEKMGRGPCSGCLPSNWGDEWRRPDNPRPKVSPTKTSAEAYRRQHAEMCRRALEYLNSKDRADETGADAIGAVAHMLESAWDEGFESSPEAGSEGWFALHRERNQLRQERDQAREALAHALACSETAVHPAERHLIADLYQAVKVLKARCGSWGAKPADEEIDETLKRVEAMVTGSEGT